MHTGATTIAVISVYAELLTGSVLLMIQTCMPCDQHQ